MTAAITTHRGLPKSEEGVVRWNTMSEEEARLATQLGWSHVHNTYPYMYRSLMPMKASDPIA